MKRADGWFCRGFTLVELLVVILIIGVLMGLLTPALIAARERARQAQCMDNQKNLGEALTQYELAKQQFPGYINRMPGRANLGTSWLVAILQELDRRDLWDAWREAANTTDEALREQKIAAASKRVGLFLCPSGNPTGEAPLSYVANCGQQDADLDAAIANGVPPDWPANGIFQRHNSVPGKDYKQVAVSIADIKDGTQHTLLISENLQASLWSGSPDAGTPSLTVATLGQEPSWGMIWWPDEATVTAHDVVHINVGRDVERSELDAMAPGDRIYYARPSSFHPGGVIATFCDGHSQFLNDKIEYLVYQLIMTPDGANAKIAGSADVPDPIPDWRKKPLDSSMLP